MQLNEHLSKHILERYGIPSNMGVLVTSIADATGAANSMGYPVAVKAQLPASGRRKIGGIRRAENAAELERCLNSVLGIRLDGMRPVSARLEPWQSPDAEVYLAVALNPVEGGPVVLFSPDGGVDVESGQSVARVDMRPDGSLNVAQFNRTVAAQALGHSIGRSLLTVALALVRAYFAVDAQLIELNPVGVYGAELVALDARIVLDDNALFRQRYIAERARMSQPRLPEDVERERSGLEYVPLPGRIGLVSGGAGMTLAAMDLIKASGAEPACFLDCSANPTPDGYRRAFEILCDRPSVEAILVSIFGGLTLVDKVARNLCDILSEGTFVRPVVFRLMGTNVEGADECLAAAGYHNHRTLEAAVTEVIAAADAARKISG